MKGLIVGLYAFFTLLLAASLYLAARSHDGLVEEGYFGEAQDYLASREREERLGLRIRVPGRLATGGNRVAAVLSTASGPLRGASAELRAMRISGPKEDQVVPLREVEPGVYAGEVRIPAAGTWLMRLSVDGEAVRTRRRWFVTADARPEPSSPTEGGIHSGPVRAVADGQEVFLQIDPRPVAAMTDLSFSVFLPGYEGPAPRIDLSMPGMRMPPNRVEMVKAEDGVYRGTGVIVRCSSGMRTWRAEVHVPAKGKAVFTFDVVR